MVEHNHKQLTKPFFFCSGCRIVVTILLSTRCGSRCIARVCGSIIISYSYVTIRRKKMNTGSGMKSDEVHAKC